MRGYRVVIARSEERCGMDRFMSFPRKRESSKTYKKLIFLGLFFK
ncbi:hypothetical protein [Rickettsia asembonensis]|nr:hypothetical protein [Rickettsia asembonensis]